MDQLPTLKYRLLTAQELAEMLNVSRKFIEKHTASGQIPGQVKIGRVWRYQKTVIERALLQGGQFLLNNERNDEPEKST